MGREIRIEFVNEDGAWEPLVEANFEYLSLHKERTLDGKSRVGFATTFKAISADSGEVLEMWQTAR